MRIRLRKTSLLDYPGKVAAVCFVRGCNLRCPWCHNRELVLSGPVLLAGPGAGGEEPAFSPEEVLAFLAKRRRVLGGVVVSGGEPCLWAGLPDIIAGIKGLGLPVKLDTNGTVPAMLERLLSREETRPGYIALDLKLAPSRYGELADRGLAVSGGPSPGEALTQSAALIRHSGIDHEFRSIALPGEVINEKDIEALAPLVDGAAWYFRPFQGGNCLDPAWDGREGGSAETLAQKARDLGKNAILP
jgi:pyruvate formate lyase activating enzyme